MERRVRSAMQCPTLCSRPAASSLLGLPDAAILEVLRHLDGRSLVSLAQTASYFTRRDPVTGLPLFEHIARESLLHACNSSAEAERFRRRSWAERLHIEQAGSCGFDRQHCEEAGFRFAFSPDCTAMRSVRLTGMGPKLLISDATTRSQPLLRWQLRVKGNTAVEFGVIPAALEPAHTALHKSLSVADNPRERAMGFCSQITAGSLLPLKAPVMRGTVLDILARRGLIEVILRYPDDAKEITWHNGQPVHKPYRGPQTLRFEQEFPADYDIRLALTSWAKGSFEVLHDGFAFSESWAREANAEEEAAAALLAAGGEAEAAAAAPAAMAAGLLDAAVGPAAPLAAALDAGAAFPPAPPAPAAAAAAAAAAPPLALVAQGAGSAAAKPKEGGQGGAAEPAEPMEPAAAEPAVPAAAGEGPVAMDAAGEGELTDSEQAEEQGEASHQGGLLPLPLAAVSAQLPLQPPQRTFSSDGQIPLGP